MSEEKQGFRIKNTLCIEQINCIYLYINPKSPLTSDNVVITGLTRIDPLTSPLTNAIK